MSCIRNSDVISNMSRNSTAPSANMCAIACSTLPSIMVRWGAAENKVIRRQGMSGHRDQKEQDKLEEKGGNNIETKFTKRNDQTQW